MSMINPCTQCKRVPVPARCDNVRCARWRNYFLQRWALIHQKGMQLLKEERE